MVLAGSDLWWQHDDPHLGVFATVERLDDIQQHRHTAMLTYLRMYSNRAAQGFASTDYSLTDSGEKLKLNVIKSTIDTATAAIATKKTKPFFLTFEGDHTLRRKAKGLQKFVSGQFYAQRIYDKSLRVFQDAAIFGTAYLKIVEGFDGQITAERVFPYEIVVDDQEARDCDPRSLYQHKEIGVEVAARLWPQFEEEIRGSKLIRDGGVFSDRLTQRVSIIEAWHLPSTPDSDDGRHVITFSNCTVVDEPWTHTGFPFAVFRLNEAPIGWHGTGFAEELIPIQVEINYTLQKIQRSLTLAASQLWVKKGQGISHLNNQDWSVNEYKDTPPTHVAVQPIHPAYLQHLQYLENKAFATVGVSQLQAMAQKPAGLSSGEAIRTYNDTVSSRFTHVEQRYEQFHLDIADLMIKVARDIEERGEGDLRVLAQGDRHIEEISFRDVSIDKNKYSMRVFPTSLLPDTPSGKLETLEQLMKILPEAQQYAIQLLDMPDLDNFKSLAAAPVEIVDKMIENILERGEFATPTPFMNLDLARHRATMALLRAQTDGTPTERVDLLRVWLTRVDKLQQMAGGAATPQQPAEQLPAEPPLGPGGDQLPLPAQ